MRQSSNIDLTGIAARLKKPLRPIWLTPSTNFFTSRGVAWDDEGESLPFYPVICVSASEAVADGVERRDGYSYVQGSADDHEMWAMVQYCS
jgi:tRNA A64-2'-O-ribosylphosphate transferase